MMHHQIMNFPFQDQLESFMAPDVGSESEPGSGIMFPVSTSPFAPSFAGLPAPTSVAAHDGNNASSPMETMREMMFRVAAMQPVRIDPEMVKPRKRRNVRISSDPQSVAARHRRERISERIRTLQRLVPGGTKMDTASMLEEAVRYLKFLKREVKSLEELSNSGGGGGGDGVGRQGWPWRGTGVGIGGPAGNCMGSSSRSSWGLSGPYSIMHSHVVGEGM